MPDLTLNHSYRYLYHSSLEPRPGNLRLATSSGTAREHPYFFRGELVHPQRTATLLRSLMRVVHTRFYTPPAMLAKILAAADPVVTCGDNRIRFEAFSPCCGVYARVDLLPAAVTGETFGRGTTNVDFNQPMLSALATIRNTDAVSIHVGSDEVALHKNSQTVVEKKVKLPIRWIKGFVEVQACQSRMQPMLEISGIEASRFLRSLPRMKTNRRETWIVPAGRGLRLSQREAQGAVRVGGLERLRVLEDLARDATTLRIFADANTGASAWELSLADSRFHLVISPEVWRGFSGEGSALAALAAKDWRPVLPQIQAALKWQAVINRQELMAKANLSEEDVDGVLTALGTRGLVGFDLAEACYFHRELPFDMDLVEKFQPRLANARKLIAAGKVRIGKRSKTETEVLVAGSDVEQRVRLTGENTKCTCVWYAKHGSTRGPCKHILAATIYLEEVDSE